MSKKKKSRFIDDSDDFDTFEITPAEEDMEANQGDEKGPELDEEDVQLLEQIWDEEDDG